MGDRSAIVMAALLTVGAWLAARLLGGPRTALLVTLALMALFDLAGLPSRSSTDYDDLQAFYSTDQVLAAQLPVPPGAGQATPTLTLLVQPVFAGAQPNFGVAGEVSGVALSWRCAFETGRIGRLALPIPTEALGTGSMADVRLHLTGSPSRESDYLLVYASSHRGGFLISLENGANASQTAATTCSVE